MVEMKVSQVLAKHGLWELNGARFETSVRHMCEFVPVKLLRLEAHRTSNTSEWNGADCYLYM